MPSVVKIKRSGSASGSPSSLAQGELAYTFTPGVDRLYIGTGTEINNEAANIEVIGGKYFTEKLDHTEGTLTANSAIIVDNSKKINELLVDDIVLDGSTISTSGTKDLILDPASNVDLNLNRIINLANPQNGGDAVNLDYLLNTFTAQLTFSGDQGSSDVINLLNDTFLISGNTGITTTTSNNHIDIDLDDTAVSPGTYGNANSIPSFTVDQQGRLTFAESIQVSIPTGQIIDFIEDVEDVVALMFSDNTENGLTINYDDAGGKLNVDVNDFDISLTGDVVGTATVTNLSNVSISTTIQPNSVALGTDTTGNYVATIAATSGTGISVSGSGVENAGITLAGIDATDTTKGVASFDSGAFTVTNGNVTLNDITIGSTVINDSVNSLSGLNSLNVGTFTVSGNTITSSTNTITFNPTGPSTTIDVSGSIISNVSDPLSSNDAVNLNYLDNSGFTISADSGSDSNILSTSGNINFVGGTGVSTTVSSEQITIDIGQPVGTTDDVVFNDGSFTGNLTVSGDLVISGNTTFVNTNTLEVGDTLIALANDNTTDAVDIGFYGKYGASQYKTGLFRSYTNGEYYLFDSYSDTIAPADVINLGSISLANLNVGDLTIANMEASGNVEVTGTVTADLFEGEMDGGVY